MAEYKSPLSALSYTPPGFSNLGDTTLSVTPAGNIKNPSSTFVPESMGGTNQSKLGITSSSDANNTDNPIDEKPQTQDNGSVLNPITGLYESGSTIGIGGKTEEPKITIPTDETTSDAFSTSKTYTDLLAKRSEYEKYAPIKFVPIKFFAINSIKLLSPNPIITPINPPKSRINQISNNPYWLKLVQLAY